MLVVGRCVVAGVEVVDGQLLVCGWRLTACTVACMPAGGDGVDVVGSACSPLPAG